MSNTDFGGIGAPSSNTEAGPAGEDHRLGRELLEECVVTFWKG
jgi:hypothetical protein